MFSPRTWLSLRDSDYRVDFCIRFELPRTEEAQMQMPCRKIAWSGIAAVFGLNGLRCNGLWYLMFFERVRPQSAS